MPDKPPNMKIQWGVIPAELSSRRAWVIWLWELKKDKNDFDKPPRQVNGRRASSTNQDTWATYHQVYQAYRAGRCDGVGYVFSADCPYVGVDFDDCRDPDTGDVQPDILSHIMALNTYTEVSPSGCGFKSISRAKLPRGGHHNDQIGVFEKGRYFCITGNIFSEVSTKIESRQSELNALIKQYWPNDFKKKESHFFTTFNHSLTDSDIIQKALNSKDAKFQKLWAGDISDYTSHSEADQALCNKLAFWTGKDSAAIDNLFRESGLMRDKWTRDNYRNRTIQKAIDFTQEEYRPRIRLAQNRKPNYEEFTNFFN